jgi:hypothetical protein
MTNRTRLTIQLTAAFLGGWLACWLCHRVSGEQNVNGTQLSRFEFQALELKSDREALWFVIRKKLETMPSREAAKRAAERWAEIGLINKASVYPALTGIVFPDERAADTRFAAAMKRSGLDFDQISQSVSSEIEDSIKSGEVDGNDKPKSWRDSVEEEAWKKGTPEGRLRHLLRHARLYERWLNRAGFSREEASQEIEEFVRNWRLTAVTETGATQTRD